MLGRVEEDGYMRVVGVVVVVGRVLCRRDCRELVGRKEREQLAPFYSSILSSFAQLSLLLLLLLCPPVFIAHLLYPLLCRPAAAAAAPCRCVCYSGCNLHSRRRCCCGTGLEKEEEKTCSFFFFFLSFLLLVCIYTNSCWRPAAAATNKSHTVRPATTDRPTDQLFPFPDKKKKKKEDEEEEKSGLQLDVWLPSISHWPARRTD